jgi:hypothetical protein
MNADHRCPPAFARAVDATNRKLRAALDREFRRIDALIEKAPGCRGRAQVSCRSPRYQPKRLTK